jgi:pimeloyl-ACP methyl ester carboxylesterase
MDTIAIDANDLRFDALAAGPAQGELVLLLHGFPQTAHSWRRLLPLLGDAGFRAIAPHLRGVSPGARPAQRDAYATEPLVADVIGLAEALGARRFHLVGHDWGGALAWQVAARHPERLSSLTVVSTPHPLAFRRALDDPATDQAQRSGYMAVFRTEGAGEDMWLGRGPAGLREIYASAGLTEEEAAPCVAAFSDRATLTAFLNWYRAGDPADPTGKPVAPPTLYVWSTGDPALGREAAEWTRDYVLGEYRFEVFDGVDHWIPEHAADRLAGLLLEHLRANAGSR